METRKNLVRVSTRPLALIVALLCALAIGLTGVYVLATSASPATSGADKPFAFVQDRPGPDAPSRNRPAPVESQDPWDGHGH